MTLAIAMWEIYSSFPQAVWPWRLSILDEQIIMGTVFVKAKGWSAEGGGCWWPGGEEGVEHLWGGKICRWQLRGFRCCYVAMGLKIVDLPKHIWMISYWNCDQHLKVHGSLKVELSSKPTSGSRNSGQTGHEPMIHWPWFVAPQELMNAKTEEKETIEEKLILEWWFTFEDDVHDPGDDEKQPWLKLPRYKGCFS